jgi:hypothetical protein
MDQPDNASQPEPLAVHSPLLPTTHHARYAAPLDRSTQHAIGTSDIKTIKGLAVL